MTSKKMMLINIISTKLFTDISQSFNSTRLSNDVDFGFSCEEKHFSTLCEIVKKEEKHC